eukprot:COSAG02_NODE_589_length_19902_cov_119.928939_12_plen_70_part_00
MPSSASRCGNCTLLSDDEEEQLIDLRLQPQSFAHPDPARARENESPETRPLLFARVFRFVRDDDRHLQT